MCYQTLLKIRNTQFHKNPLNGIRVVEYIELNGTDKQRDRHGGTKRCTVVTFLSVCKNTLYEACQESKDTSGVGR
jgi:hypothetical protein